MRRAFFFDRDGVVNRDPYPEPYILSWDQWIWNAGIFEFLREIKLAGYLTVLVTSQKGVGKGLMSEADLEEIHARMQGELREQGFPFDAIYAYTGLPTSELRPKPDPQMVLKSVQDLGIDLSQSVLIGDADRDIAMADAAGIPHTIRFKGLKPVGHPAGMTLSELDPTLIARFLSPA